MREAIVTEYVDLCDRLGAVTLEQAAEEKLYGRLDQLWYVEMSDDEVAEAERRLIAKDVAVTTTLEKEAQ